MPRQLFVFDPPERFVAGTVGQPGDRTFYLQATGGGRTVTVALEKVQVQVLAERLEELLQAVRIQTDADVPPPTARTLEDTAPLDTPVEEEFRVGTMGLAWETDDERLVIEALAQPETEQEAEVEPLSDVDEGPDALRVRITADMARAFIAPGAARRRRRPAAVPAVRPAAGPRGPHLPAPERPPPLTAIDLADALALLRDGELSVEGRLLDASNATLYCSTTLDGVTAACVYKPVRGERPLWDFPDGTLAGREVATYLVSDATGWDVVPPTVMRDGPFGPGMCQLWVDVDESVDLAALARSDHPDLRRMAVLDAVVNNADRKGGHLLPDHDGRVQGIDHGLCFATEDKLRTLLWQWRGEPLTDEAVEVLSRLRVELEADLGAALLELLTRREVRRTVQRVDRLLTTGVHPSRPRTGRRSLGRRSRYRPSARERQRQPRSASVSPATGG